MRSMKRLLVYLAFSLLFLLVFLPLGSLMRWLIDPLRLRRNRREQSYFRMAMTGATEAQPPQPPQPGEANAGLVGKR